MLCLNLYIEGFHGSHVGGLKQFCMKIDLISQGRENVEFLPSNMAAMTSHENALYQGVSCYVQWLDSGVFPKKVIYFGCGKIQPVS